MNIEGSFFPFIIRETMGGNIYIIVQTRDRKGMFLKRHKQSISVIRWKSAVSQQATGKETLKVSALTCLFFFLFTLPEIKLWRRGGHKQIFFTVDITVNKTMRLKGRRTRRHFVDIYHWACLEKRKNSLSVAMLPIYGRLSSHLPLLYSWHA